MSRRAVSLLASAGLLLAAGSAGAEPASRVGLVVGVRVNVAEPRAAAVAAAMEQVLERDLQVDVVRADGAAIDRDLPPACATDPVCLSGLAARVEVEELLFLVVVGAGDRVRVEFSRRHPVTGEVTHPPALILDPDPAEMDRQIAAMATQLPDASPRAEAEPASPRPIEPVAVAPDRDPGAGGAGKRAAGLVVAAAGLALTGSSLYFVLRARSDADQLEERHPPDDPGTWSEKDESLEDAHFRHKTWATVLGIAGGAALATGATLYALGVRDRSRARERVSIAIGDRAGLLVFAGFF
jgi:hypothetical protein